MKQLLALTLAQPWPWAVLELGKRLENRTWADHTAKSICNNQSWLAIHGGKVPPAGKNKRFLKFQSDLEWLQLESPAQMIGDHDPRNNQIFFSKLEGIVAICKLEAIYTPGEGLAPRHASQAGWSARDENGYHNQYAWILSEPLVFKNPVKVSGAQGLWAVTGDVLEQVRVEARRAREKVSP